MKDGKLVVGGDAVLNDSTTRVKNLSDSQRENISNLVVKTMQIKDGINQIAFGKDRLNVSNSELALLKKASDAINEARSALTQLK